MARMPFRRACAPVAGMLGCFSLMRIGRRMYNGKQSILEVINCARLGGGMRHLLGLFQNLDPKRYHFALIADKGDYLIDSIRELNIPIHVVPMMHSRFDLRTARQIARVARAEGADVLHCHGTRAAFFGAMAKPFCKVKKSIYTVHGFSYNKDMPHHERMFYLWVERMLGKAHDRLISVSKFDRDEAILRKVCSPDRISAVPNAIDFDQFNPVSVNGEFRAAMGLDPKIRLVGTAARFVPQKGIEYLLESAKLILDTHSDIRFVIVGEGDLEKKLKTMAAEKGLAGKVFFTGPSMQMAQVYAGLDVFVLASLWEGHPLSLIEALAMKTPTVATKTSGSPEIIQDGTSGLLVPPKDPKSLADAVIKLLDDRAFAQNLAENGRKSVIDRYSFSKMTRQTENVFRDLLPDAAIL